MQGGTIHENQWNYLNRIRTSGAHAIGPHYCKLLPMFQFKTPHGIVIPEETKGLKFGHLTTNLAFKLAKKAGKKPPEVALEIASAIEKDERVERVEVAGGFVNIFLKKEFLRQFLLSLHGRLPDAGWESGRPPTALHRRGNRYNLEFVSANPTGPLNVVNARAAAIGDSLVRIGRFLGYESDAEYYVNDEGTQIEMLGWAILWRLGFISQEELPEDAYRGEYVKDIAEALRSEVEKMVRESKDLQSIAYSTGKMGADHILQSQMKTLHRFRVRYDRITREGFIRQSEYPVRALRKLSERELLYFEAKDGTRKPFDEFLKTGEPFERLLNRDFYLSHFGDMALYLKTTDFGDDKDRVIIRSSGLPTYFFWDIAYHFYKMERGYDYIVDFLGPDHHGYIGRLRAALSALGFDVNHFHVEIVQQTNLLKEGKKVRMSKRKGQLYTMDELLDEVGVDAARFFFLMRSPSAHLDFDMTLASRIGKENPVYYVQYVHARVQSIKQHADGQKIAWSIEDLNLDISDTDYEKEMVRKLLYFEMYLHKAYEKFEPHHLVFYLMELADTFHSFYQNVRVVDPEDPERSRSRIALLDVLRKVIGTGLNLIGVRAPDRM